MLRGVDIASHQGTNINWSAARAAGYSFAIIKATGGGSYVNPYHDEQVAGARSAGFVIGHYHYDLEGEWPGPGSDAEAAHFLAHAHHQPGDLLALDVEETAVPAREDLLARTRAFLDAIESGSGRVPLLYSGWWYMRPHNVYGPTLARYPLWFSSYQTERPPTPPGWDGITIWQHDASTRVPGFAAPIDVNVFDGTIEQLRALGSPTQTPVPPGPTPPYVRAYINQRGEAVTEICWGGVAVHVDGYVITDDGEKWSRSVSPAGFGDWHKEGA
jgi:GH25 family lysozyme M1 (1,4-beta-N-acetylmuramidase)